MKTTYIPSILSITALFVTTLGAILSVSSCAPANPALQKQMDRDILSDAENRKPGNSTGSQQGQNSKNYGHGGF